MPVKLTVKRPADFIEFEKSAINQGIHQRFEEMAGRYPDKIAIKTQDASITYAQLNGFANTVARAILALSGPELAQTAILLPNIPATIFSMLGSLKAHKAYVPVDVHFPRERLRAMIADSNPVVLLTDDAHLGLAEELAAKGTQILNLSTLRLRADEPNPGLSCLPMDRAYLLYTSGTTGKPKGIEFLHRNLLHTTMCLTNELFFSPSDRVTWLHSPTFGSSVVDIYCCLTNGGTLLPWDTKARGLTGMVDWLLGERATTLQWIPSAFRQFIRTVPSGCVLADVRIVVMAGEPLTLTEVEMFRKHFAPGSHLVNQVGTAESYNYYLYRVDHHLKIEGASVPGGYPVSGDRQLLILDDDRRELPRGSVGEIGIRSEYMAAGYWRDEAQTRAKFAPIGGDPRPVYLTGDLGSLNDEGCLTHLGRKDFQLKLRGCRIEVAEIEHLLQAYAGIADAAAWVAKNRMGEDQLVAYVVPERESSFDREKLMGYLESLLPEYMVPRHYVSMDRLPTLPTGKVNRKELPNPFSKNGRLSQPDRAGTKPVAEEIAAMFRELLQSGEIDVNADFYREGGDSLLAAVLTDRIFKRFDVEIAPGDLPRSLTPARLAEEVEKMAGVAPSPVRHLPSTSTKAGDVGSAARADRPWNRIPMSGPQGWKLKSDGLRASRSVDGIKDLLIIGAGEYGREIFTWAAQAIAAGAPWRIKGFLDTRAAILEGYDYDVGVISGPEDYCVQPSDVFVGALGDPRDKMKFYSPIVRKGGQFINIIHPLANVGVNVRFGNGNVLGPFASVTTDVRVGDHVSIGAFSNVAHDTVIGDWCQICSHCGVNGRAELAEGVFLGSHACVIPRVQVGAWAYIGAGSIVVRNVPAEAKMFGNPAAVIGKTTPGVYRPTAEA
jgi:sugar O-acyltransferase (sialic acid O-acetyltransferase NeuD family)